MEGLKKRSFILAGVLLVAGVFSIMRTSQAATPMTEKTLEERAPRQVPGFQMLPGPEGLDYTYKMDKSTYEVLKPFGIVARQFTDGGRTFDVALITSDSHESFHDPKICFSGQGFTFKTSREDTIDVPGRGAIPVTIVEMTGPREESTAAYFYHGPNGFVANPKRLQLDMFKEVLFGRKAVNATFYRFMPVNSIVDVEQLKDFIKTYMVAAAQESGGFF